MTEFLQVDEFAKDLKKLRKKFRNIDKDLEVFIKALKSEFPYQLPGTVQISGLGEEISIPIFKVRHFRSRDLKGGSRSGIRLIYAYNSKENEITLIEIYFKGDKENEDQDRIKRYFTSKPAKASKTDF
jgi:mRNA-degrading endonuclease RelE of RelBE toxin-antitoxin system